MLAGVPAFRGKDLRQTYQRVLFAELVFEPESRFSEDAKELLRGLLNRDPNLRLGAGENPPTDIMSMNFFRGIDWVSIFERHENGPYVPNPAHFIKGNTRPEEYSTVGNPKFNIRDSIIAPGTLDPNALQDWSFFDEKALSKEIQSSQLNKSGTATVDNNSVQVTDKSDVVVASAPSSTTEHTV